MTGRRGESSPATVLVAVSDSPGLVIDCCGGANCRGMCRPQVSDFGSATEEVLVSLHDV